MNEQNNREEAKDYDPMKAEQEYHENEACLRPNAGLYNPEMNVMADDYDMESGDGTEKIGGCTVKHAMRLCNLEVSDNNINYMTGK